jgi:hypothetical protein
LYKRPILVERGSFRPITNLTLDLLTQAHEQFLQDPSLEGELPVVLMEMTLRNLTSESGIDHQDYLARVDILRELGQTVLISNYARYFRLVEYLSRYTRKPIGIAVGVPSLRELANDEHYGDLAGGLLESAGRLFKTGVRLYVYPSRDPISSDVISAHTLPLPASRRSFLTFLLENHLVESIRNYNPDYLSITTPDVLAKLQSGDPAWENMVPPPIVRAIKRDRLFGWQPPTTM